MATILDTPVTADGVGGPLHAHSQAAEVIARFDGLLAIANAVRHHQADRLQTFPQFKARQARRRRQLEVAACLLTPMPRFAGLIAPDLHAREVVVELLLE